jgi:transcriptional regulator with XRE-family HTH domain
LVKWNTKLANMDNQPTPSDLIARRVRDLRKARGMTVAELAARCGSVGMPKLTAQALYKLEGQRESATRNARPVTVDELLALAYVLDAAPAHLIAGLDDTASFPVTPAVSVPAADVRQWIRGWPHSRGGLPGSDGHWYRMYTPDSEDRMVTLPEDEYDELVRARNSRGTNS